jgi:hypothetical protein
LVAYERRQAETKAVAAAKAKDSYTELAKSMKDGAGINQNAKNTLPNVPYKDGIGLAFEVAGNGAKLFGGIAAVNTLNKANPLHNGKINSINQATTLEDASKVLKSGKAKTYLNSSSKVTKSLGRASLVVGGAVVAYETGKDYFATGNVKKATGTAVAETADFGVGVAIVTGAAWGGAVGAPAFGIGAVPGSAIGGIIGAVAYYFGSQTEQYQGVKAGVKSSVEGGLGSGPTALKSGAGALMSESATISNSLSPSLTNKNTGIFNGGSGY